MRVFVSGPYSAGNVVDVLRNIGKGEQITSKLFELGYCPFNPWSDRNFIINNPHGTYSLNMFYQYCFKWLEVSDVMLVTGISPGVQAEIDFCKERKIPVVYSIEELKTVNV